jgi:hypothetical protein
MYASPVVMEVGNYSAEPAFFEINGSPHLRISLFPAISHQLYSMHFERHIQIKKQEMGFPLMLVTACSLLNRQQLEIVLGDEWRGCLCPVLLASNNNI